MPVAVIAGVGGGLGAALVHRFASTYPVALIARSEKSLAPIVAEVEAKGGQAKAILGDMTDAASVARAFAAIDEAFPGETLSLAVYNVAAPFKAASFLDLTAADRDTQIDATQKGSFNFAQQVLKRFVVQTDDVRASLPHAPTLLFSGATAAIRAGAKMSIYSPAKWAQRGMSQALAKEFGPQGIHVAHIVLDGVINGPRSAGFQTSVPKLEPEAAAESYWLLHTQPKMAWSWELDLRTYAENW